VTKEYYDNECANKYTLYTQFQYNANTVVNINKHLKFSILFNNLTYHDYRVLVFSEEIKYCSFAMQLIIASSATSNFHGMSDL